MPKSRIAKRVIIGVCLFYVLVAVFVTSLLIKRNRVGETMHVMVNLGLASLEYQDRHDVWPFTISQLSNSYQMTSFLERKACIDKDAWSQPFEYQAFSEQRGYGVIKSLGARMECRFGRIGTNEFSYIVGAVESQGQAQ